MARRTGVVVLAAGLVWASIQACGGESVGDVLEPSDATGGTGNGGDSAGGSGGAATGGSGGDATGGSMDVGGGGTGGRGGMPSVMGGTAGTVTGGTGGAGAGGVPSCEDVREEIREELAAIQSCQLDSECGQELHETSCGCTRNLVARLDADVTRFDELRTTEVNGETCYDFSSGCDCPRTNGFECQDGRCNWRYVDPTSCEYATIGSLCVVGPDDGMLDVGDRLTIMVGASGCYSSSCTETVIGECLVDKVGDRYVGSAQICLSVDTSGACTDDCGGAGSPRCEAATPLTAGTHTVTLGGFSLSFEVPSALSGARCAGFL